MQTKTRMNVYFAPDLLKKVEALALPSQHLQIRRH